MAKRAMLLDMTTTTDLLTSTQAGQLLGKSGRTVTRMAEAGKIPIAQRLPGVNGPNLFRRGDIEALLESADDNTTALAGGH